MKYPANINEMLNSQGFQYYQADKLGNDLFISDPERAERLWEAAEDGSDGSFHCEVIEDWREYAQDLFSDAERELWAQDLSDKEFDVAFENLEALRDNLLEEIDACENWHQENGTLSEMIG
jgi:hypothetical protein